MARFAAIPIHPVLLAVYPVALTAALNRGEILPESVLIAIATLGAASTVLLFFFRYMLSSWHASGCATFAAVVFFYAYGPVGAAIDRVWLAKSDHGDMLIAPIIGYWTPIILSLAWGIGLLLALRWIAAMPPERLRKITGPLNLTALLLLSTAVIHWFNAEDDRPSARLGNTANPDIQVDEDAWKPDFYYVVLDGYARADILREHYGYDNSEFIGALEERGFVIDPASLANYYWTFLSLASSLNMDYIPTILGDLSGATSKNIFVAYEAIRKNSVAQMLQDRGYRFVHLQSSWGATLHNPYADEMIPCSNSLMTNEFYRTLAEMTWLRALNSHASADLADCHLTNLATLETVAEHPGPKFVFAHLILPHHPYLFDRNGNVLRDATIANQLDFQARLWEDKDSYIEQLRFVNKAIVETITAIQTKSKREPIIVLQSDHGPQLANGMLIEERRRVRLANLSAWSLPDAPRKLVPTGDSPVNLFRRILNFYFDTGLPMLENKHYYSSFREPFKFEDITDAVRSAGDHLVANPSNDKSPRHPFETAERSLAPEVNGDYK